MKDTNEARKELEKRYDEDFDNQNDYGDIQGKWPIKNIDNAWKCNAGGHYIDVIPYDVGPNHPKIPEGERAYCLDFWVHFNEGPHKADAFLCLAKMFNERCPICEHKNKLKSEEYFDEDKIKDLTPKRRTLYNILCSDNEKEEEKGVQVWHVAHFYMQKNLLPLVKDERTGEKILFADPIEGRTIWFERDGMTQKSNFLGHKFVKRVVDGEPYVIDQDLLDEACRLEDLLVIPTYEEVYESHWGEKPKSASRKSIDSDENSSSGEDRGRNFSGSRRRTASDEDKPEESSRRRRTEAPDGKDEEKVEESVEKEGEGCPAGHVFGEDHNKHLPDCEDACSEDKWIECKNKKQELKDSKDEKKKTVKKGRRRVSKD